MVLRCLILVSCVAVSILQIHASKEMCKDHYEVCKEECGKDPACEQDCKVKDCHCNFLFTSNCKQYLTECIEKFSHNKQICYEFYLECDAQKSFETCENRCDVYKKTCTKKRMQFCDVTWKKCKDKCQKFLDSRVCDINLAVCSLQCSKIVNTCPSGCFTFDGVETCEDKYLKCEHSCYEASCRCKEKSNAHCCAARPATDIEPSEANAPIPNSSPVQSNPPDTNAPEAKKAPETTGPQVPSTAVLSEPTKVV